MDSVSTRLEDDPVIEVYSIRSVYLRFYVNYFEALRLEKQHKMRDIERTVNNTSTSKDFL